MYRDSWYLTNLVLFYIYSFHFEYLKSFLRCPFNDNIIASASEDCSVKIWMIKDGGLDEPLRDEVSRFNKHENINLKFFSIFYLFL